MQATVKQVKAFVGMIADMKGSVWGRRCWTDKAADETKRNLTFRFYSATEADKVAARLQDVLTAQGYANKVKRTSVVSCAAYAVGGEYVRVQAVFE